MEAEHFVETLRRERAVAILRTPVAETVGPAMDAAIRGGFRVIEFTMNTPQALERISEFSAREDVVVGAGTVMTPGDARAALDAGASFLVSPVVDEDVVAVAVEAGVAMIPGTHTPTEMERAHQLGAPLQKLFPAPGIGPAYIKACLGPLPHLRIVPTSGVTAENARDYLGAGAFAVGFVQPLFDPVEVAEGRVDRIEERARQLLALARG